MKIPNPTIESLLETIEAQVVLINQLEARIQELEQGSNVLSSIQTIFSGTIPIPAGC
ncbi:MAG: hypothetical protein WC627_07740 [Legionella sp.]|jgi:hypothetical protein